MKLAACFFTVFCAFAFSQTAPSANPSDNNAAAESMRNRMKTLTLDPPQGKIRLVPNNVVVVETPGTCAIPLLNAAPQNFSSKMPLVDLPPSPRAETSRAAVVQGMPTCKESSFRLK